MAQTNDTQTGSLQDFSFDNDNAGWFGMEAGEADTATQTIKEVKGETVNKEPKKETTVVTPEEDEEEDVTFFADEEPVAKVKKKKEAKVEEDEDEPEVIDEEDEEEEEEKPKKKDKKEKEEVKGEEDGEEDEEKFYSTLVSELKEKGIFQNVEIKEGEKLTEEKFFELQDAEIEARVEETFEAFAEELDEDGKDFIKFKKDGGKTQDFLAIYVNKGNIDLENFDEDNDKQVKQVLRQYLSSVEGLEGEDLEDRLEWIKDSGKEKTYATKYFNKIKKDFETTRENLIKTQAKAAKLREDSIKKFNEELGDLINTTEAVGAFPITKTDQKELNSYILKPSVKVGKNKYVPQMQADLSKVLRAETKEDRQKLILIGKLLKNNFDVKDLVVETTTKVAKKAKSKLQEAKKGMSGKTSGSYSKRSLTDFFS